jgi:serine/threonine protein kinase
LGNLRSFLFKELQLVTDSFSSKNILGFGGFGNIYRGRLGNGTMVIVKCLNDVTRTMRESQFRFELQLIRLVVHRNLLRLIGLYAIPSERLFVYPYIANGSVASRLRLVSYAYL